ncbi:TonB-dependent receptor [Nevskia ramosa]|uniref:TonB-dependent receptor n=1 Tax=Nevskia ramosa TaxID=64002 RepID=UPI0003B4E7C7|nr:TonB-dependent receptor [Nevskia ramosa]
MNIRTLVSAATLGSFVAPWTPSLAQEPVEPVTVTPEAAAADAAPVAEPSPAVAVTATASPTTVAPDVARIEEIVVTATRRNGYIDDIPASISAYGGEDLKAVGVRDTRELSKLVAGFTAADSGFNTPIYTLRGVGFADSSFANQSTVGVYLDEVALPYPVMTKGPNLDLRRVEVLKGPQGTLYGRNSTGGTINYIANKPTKTFTAGAEVTGGSYGRLDTEGFISGPITDNLRVRLAGSMSESQTGWQTSNTRPDDRLGKVSKRAARGIADWDVVEDVSVRLAVSGWLDKSEPQAPYAVDIRPQNPLVPGNASISPRLRDYPLIPNNNSNKVADWNPDGGFGLNDNFWNATLRPQWNINENLKLIGLFAYSQVRSDGSALPQGGTDLENIDQFLTGNIRTVSGEVRLEGTIGSTADWLVGVNSNYDEYGIVSEGRGSENSLNFPLYGSTPPLFTPLVLNRGSARGDGQIRSNGAFADASWAFIETLKLTAGVRYSREAQAYSGCTYENADNDSIVPLSALFTFASIARGGSSVVRAGDCGSVDADGNAGLYSDHLKQDNISYRGVLSWTPIKDTLFYGSYTRGFKSGGFPTVFSVDQASLAPVVQERLDAYEVGAKLGLFDNRVQINSAAFYYDYKNKQLLTYFSDPIFGNLQYLQNVPKSRVEGGEITATWLPIKNLNLTALGSYVRTKVIEFVGQTATGDDFDFAGRPFNYAPHLQTSLLANYTFTIDNSLNVSPGVVWTHTGETNSTLEGDPVFKLNEHQIIDVRLGFSAPGQQWQVTAFVRNLTNEFYRASVVNLGDTAFAYAGQPRIVGVTFSYDVR